jgi:hypothetical protein
VTNCAKRTANVVGHGVRADLLRGGAVAVAAPAVWPDTATEGMDVLKDRKRLSVWLRIDYHHIVCNLLFGVYHRYMDTGSAKPACFR